MRCVIGCVCCALAGLLLGAVVEDFNLHHHQFLDRERLIKRVLSAHPEFRAVRIDEESSGDAYVAGTVESEAALQELRRLIIAEVACEWTQKYLAGVQVATTPHNTK
jgi:hypothetical protein